MGVLVAAPVGVTVVVFVGVNLGVGVGTGEPVIKVNRISNRLVAST